MPEHTNKININTKEYLCIVTIFSSFCCLFIASNILFSIIFSSDIFSFFKSPLFKLFIL